MKITVYTISVSQPYYHVRPKLCEIVYKPQSTWAIDERGARHKVGGSAFLSYEAAETRQKVLLKRMVDDERLRKHEPDKWGWAKRVLIKLNSTKELSSSTLRNAPNNAPDELGS